MDDVRYFHVEGHDGWGKRRRDYSHDIAATNVAVDDNGLKFTNKNGDLKAAFSSWDYFYEFYPDDKKT